MLVSHHCCCRRGGEGGGGCWFINKDGECERIGLLFLTSLNNTRYMITRRRHSVGGRGGKEDIIIWTESERKSVEEYADILHPDN